MKKIPVIGDRVERRVAGLSRYGTVHYADQLQVLVKWDDGSSSSLRVDIHELRIVSTAVDREGDGESREGIEAVTL
jgi:hypothetical protein